MHLNACSSQHYIAWTWKQPKSPQIEEWTYLISQNSLINTLRISFQKLSSVQFNSVTQSCPTLCELQHTRLPCLSPSLLKLMSIALVMPSNHLILCHPLLLPPSILPRIRVFSNELVLILSCPKSYYNWRSTESTRSEAKRTMSQDSVFH